MAANSPLSRRDSAELFKVLADETRLRILHSLFEKPKCVTEIMKELDLAQSHVSHHLKILKTAGVVEFWREGHRICYALHPDVKSSLSENRQETLDLGCCVVKFRG